MSARTQCGGAVIAADGLGQVPLSGRPGTESASKAWPHRAALPVLALFAVLLSLTLAAPSSADASTGAFIKAYGWGVSDGAKQFETCTTTCYGGIGGAGAGEFESPAAVATDSSGDVYVADEYNSRIDEFSAAGAFIKAYGWGVADGADQFETCTTTCQSGNGDNGGGAGELFDPTGIATDSSGDVYVTGDARINEFSAAGAFVKAYGWGVVDGANQFETCTTTCQTGIGGGGAGQLDAPVSVATDSSGDVYVADETGNRIDEFSASGAFITAYGWGVADGARQFETCTTTCQTGIGGSGAGQFYTPTGVATDPSGDVYVADEGNNRIDEFSAAGAFIMAYGWGVADGASRFETCTTTCEAGIGGGPEGDGDGAGGAGALFLPWGVATDSSGDVYVADLGNERIDEFSAAGAFIAAYGWGVSDGASKFETCTTTCQAGPFDEGDGFENPTDVAIDPSGDVYVADYAINRIDEFSVASAVSPVSPSGTGTSTTPTTTPVTTHRPATYTPPAPPAGGTEAPPGATPPDPIVKVLPPTAEATATPTNGTLGYQLSGKGTTAASGHKITSWVWKLGNKIVGRKETTDIKLHAYNTKYSYTLTVTQSGGDTGSASVTVEEARVKGITTKTITNQLTISSDTLFAWNSFALTSEAKAELNAVRAAIKASKSVVVSGYCDDTGDNDPVSVGNSYNVWLSTERALAVADFVYDNKIPKTTKLVGYGRTHFVATNATAAGRAENRRVTIQFK
jgi:outer membrane protein OmpA-like peptidoglycan-associated protein